DHAQSEYWIGYVDYERNRFVEAKPAWLAYKQLADRMVALAPDNPNYQREAGHADENLCLIALKPPKKSAAALNYCWAALAHKEVAARELGASSGIGMDLANGQAWLADAYLANHDKDRALAHRLIEEQILNALMAADPKNISLKRPWVALQRML